MLPLPSTTLRCDHCNPLDFWLLCSFGFLTTTMASYSGFDSVTLCAPAGDCFPGTPSPSEPITTPIKTPITNTTTAPSHCACHHPPPTPCQVSKFLLSYFQAMSKTTTTAHGPRPQQSPPPLTPLPQPSPLPPNPPPVTPTPVFSYSSSFHVSD